MATTKRVSDPQNYLSRDHAIASLEAIVQRLRMLDGGTRIKFNVGVSFYVYAAPRAADANGITRVEWSSAAAAAARRRA
jgi:hypothetical protein